MTTTLIIALLGFAASGADAAATSNFMNSKKIEALQAPPADAAAAQAAVTEAFDYTSWSVGGIIGVVVAIVIAIVAIKFTRGAKKEEDGNEAAAEGAAASSSSEPLVEDGSKATDYQELLKVLAQKVAQETGPKLSKAGAVKNVLETRMASFSDKAKSFMLSEMNGTAGAVLRQLDAPEAMMLLDWDHAVEANFPPASILIAGVLSPTVINLMSLHHIIQMVFVGIPILILCICALHTDWSAPCSAIPTIFLWLFTQAGLAVALTVGHGMLVVKIAMGKKRLAAKAEELHEKHHDEDSVTNLRDEFVDNTIVLQEALLVENEIRHSIWNTIVGLATFLWVITTIWNLVLICGWTFVPGIVAFHPKAAEVAKDEYCGAWMTVLVLRINMLLAVLFFFLNLGTVVQWVCDMMIENQGFQTSVINQARTMDKNGSGLPVMELLVKAFLLRGGSDTLNNRLAVVQTKKSAMEKEQAALQKELAALEGEITSTKAEESTLKQNCIDQGGELAEQIAKMESQGLHLVEDVEAKAQQIREETTKALEELYEKISEAVDQLSHSELAKQMSAKFEQLEGLAEDAIAAAKDPVKQKELMDAAQASLMKAKKAAEDVAAAASDPAKRAELEEAAKNAMAQAKKAAADAAEGLQDPELQAKLKKAAKEALDHAKETAQVAVQEAEKQGKIALAKAKQLEAEAEKQGKAAVEKGKAAIEEAQKKQ